MMMKSLSAVQQPCTMRAGSAAPRVACPSAPLRSSVVRRFKEDDNNELVEKLRNDVEKVRTQQDKPIERLLSGDSLKNVIDGSDAPPRYASDVKVAWWMPAFTRRREVYIGRVAQLGLLAAAAQEIANPQHIGPIQQLRLATGLDSGVVVAIVSGIIVYNIVGALGPWSPTYSDANLRDVAKRPPGPPNQMVSPFEPKKFLGISGWGWSKRNELFNGRLAMLGFWAAFNNELVTSKGPLGQVAQFFNIVPDADFYSKATYGGLIFFASMIGLSLVLGSKLQGNTLAEDEIY